jgi:hypothetical protein
LAGTQLARLPAVRPLASAALALGTLFFYGCANTLPATPVGMDEGFANGQVPVRSVVLLPADLQVVVYDEHGHPGPPALLEEVSRNTGAALQDGTRALLARRGYAIAGELSWDGTISFGDGRRVQALDGQAMAELYGALTTDQPPRPELAAQLAQVTGADALFALSGSGQDIPGESTGEKVAKGIAIGLFIVVVAVALLMVTRGKGGGGGGAARAAAGAGRAVHFATPAGARLGGAAVRTAMVPIPVGHVHGPGCNLALGIHDGYYYGEPQPAPEHGNDSGLGLSMRLVGLRNPRLLWFADQWAEGSPRDGDFVRRFGDHVSANLPPAR